MSNQCRNCGRDVNNNYTPYANAYGNKTNTQNDKSSSSTKTNSTTPTSNQITAKVMFGTVGAINELREKEQAEKNSSTRAGRRQ